MDDIDVERPEKDALFLPSHFTEAARVQMDLKALGVMERELRQGIALNSLQDVRDGIRKFNDAVDFKRNNLHGIHKNTQGGRFLNTLRDEVWAASTIYRVSRAGLLKLGMGDDDPVFRPLLQSDLKGKAAQKQRAGQ